MNDLKNGPIKSRETTKLRAGLASLTFCILMDSSFWFDTISWDSPLHISKGVRLYFYIYAFFMDLDFH